VLIRFARPGVGDPTETRQTDAPVAVAENNPEDTICRCWEGPMRRTTS
jgi:hypothetical protein